MNVSNKLLFFFIKSIKHINTEIDYICPERICIYPDFPNFLENDYIFIKRFEKMSLIISNIWTKMKNHTSNKHIELDVS